MDTEISGDGRLTLAERIRYLTFNFKRNLTNGEYGAKRFMFCAERLPRTPTLASPSRALTEAFLHRQLTQMGLPGKLRVLEIGCGSGSLTKLLTEFGYSGSYVGVDIADRFDRTAQPGFDKEFVQIDAHCFEPEGEFDLIISVSALEHIPKDPRLIERLNGYLGPNGVQIHFVPSGWGLPTYLWHGYRQYTVPSLCSRFDPKRVHIYAMGGVSSFLLHFLFITGGEILMRLKLRQRLPRIYGWMLDACLKLDRFVPACSTMYAVCQPKIPVSD